ncbi:MAG TPA: permease [Woeseiaceae bacterium]|nr:permease [Woeseiaceae bacterium]
MSFDYHWHDFLGNLGVLLIIVSYFWMQIGRISGQDPLYSIVNAIGAALVLVSLYFDFNLSAFLVETFWLIISILGLFLGSRKIRRIGVHRDE